MTEPNTPNTSTQVPLNPIEHMAWIKFYTDDIFDPRIRQMPGRLFKLWVCLLCIARRRDGQIVPEEAYSLLNFHKDYMHKMFTKLIELDLICEQDGHILVTRWKQKQEKPKRNQRKPPIEIEERGKRIEEEDRNRAALSLVGGRVKWTRQYP